MICEHSKQIELIWHSIRIVVMSMKINTIYTYVNAQMFVHSSLCPAILHAKKEV